MTDQPPRPTSDDLKAAAAEEELHGLRTSLLAAQQRTVALNAEVRMLRRQLAEREGSAS